MKSTKLAIVMSRFNEEITGGLLKGALDYLESEGVDSKKIPIYYAPGAFEIPLIAKKLTFSRKYDGIICLGCVIKGETAHFEYISLGATVGIQQVALESGIPVSFGVLTVYTEEQAKERSKKNQENKGKEAAAACLETVFTLRKI